MNSAQVGHFDVAVIGSGIVGLAFAYTARKAGKSVVIFERNPAALGATIRNFGMIWPIGQAGGTIERALKSRSIWLELADKAGFWAQPSGSLHLAYHEDELNVLEEFVATTQHLPYQTTMLTPLATIEKSHAVNPIGLEGAMFSATEVNIDPREATQRLHQYFQEKLDITFHYQTAITEIDYPSISNGVQSWNADQIFVCSGADFETLYPEIFKNSGMTKCKLQMMRTIPQPNQWQLGPNLAAGLTLQHYSSFAHCESLTKLRKRLSAELPLYNKWGIHVMISQCADGALTIGDSHEYGWALSPFDRDDINQLIIKYLKRFTKVPTLQIAEYWNGIYAKKPGATEYIYEVDPNITIVNGLSGAGMTLSFGLAAEILNPA